jgi:hypothetical protein
LSWRENGEAKEVACPLAAHACGRSGAAPHLESAVSFFAIFKSIRRMRKKPARAIAAVAFHQIVQDAPGRLNSLRFGMICQAAVISIISNRKFKGLARVSLRPFGSVVTTKLLREWRWSFSGIARRATVHRVAISGAGLGAEEIATNGNPAPFGPKQRQSKGESEVRTITVPEESISIIHEMPDPAAARVVCAEASNASILARADRRRLNDACTTLLLPQALRTNR